MIGIDQRYETTWTSPQPDPAVGRVSGRVSFRWSQVRPSGHPQFRFIRTLTRGPGPPPRGRNPALLLSRRERLAGHDVFIAGAPAFVLARTAATEALGASRARVHTELFFAEPRACAAAA